MRDSSDKLTEGILTILVVLISATLIVFFATLSVLGLGLSRYLWARQAEETEEEPLSPIRMFGAPASVRWLAAYDYCLYRLEKVSGIEFSTTPARLMTGSLIISLVPAFVIGLPVMLVDAAAGRMLLTGLGAVGFVVGSLTGWSLTGPAAGWFDFTRTVDSPRDDELEGLILGEEDW